MLNSLPQTIEHRFQKGNVPHNKGEKNFVERVCRFCGKTFLIAESALKRNRGIFCSKQCFYDNKKKFSKRAMVFKLYKERKTYKEISQILGIPQSTVGYYVYKQKICNRYGDGIINGATRQRIKNLLNINSCELCGYDRILDVAHIVPRKDGGKWTLDNVLILCPNCHRLFDKNLLNDEEREKLNSIERVKKSLEVMKNSSKK